MEAAAVENAKAIFAGLSALVALAGFIVAVAQYVVQTRIRRYEKFTAMSQRFDDDKSIKRVVGLLRGGKGELPDVHDKEVFICFVEEIAFMIRSKIMKRDLGLYTFGYYAKLALNSDAFWQDLQKDEPFYAEFIEFCKVASQYRYAKVEGPFKA